MDIVRNFARLFGACFAALALSLTVHAGNEFLMHQNQTTSADGIWVNRSVIIIASDGQPYTSAKQDGSQNPDSYYPANSGDTFGPFRVATGGYSGASEVPVPVTYTPTAGGHVKVKRAGGQAISVHCIADMRELPTDDKAKAAWGGLETRTWIMEPMTVTVNFETGQVEYPEEPEPEKVMGEGILMLENATGVPQTIPFGDELLELQPGMNSFPFYGEVDEAGIPKAAGDVLLGKSSQAGQTAWYGKLENGVESTKQWSANPPPPIVYPPSSSSSGPTVKVPGQSSDSYYTLPPGMTAGNNLPLPGGMTAGSPGIPKGVTPGSNGALPSGVVSGGTTHLPSGVSAGTVAGNAPSSGGGGSSGGTGGTGGSGGGSNGTNGTKGSTPGGVVKEDSDGPYVPGGDMSQMYGQGTTMGREGAEKIAGQIGDGLGEIGTKAKGVLGSESPKWWTAQAGLFDGTDASWLTLSLPIAQWTPSIEIPSNLVYLIRAILLWGIKIWFVVACIKLVLK